MNVLELISVILNVVFGSGWLISLLKLRQTKEQMQADIRGKELENEEKASKIVMEYVVEPLKKEMNSLRREVQRFRKAVEKIPTCPMAQECPVNVELKRKHEDSL
ncbi:MAG: hypothetical protein II945_05235 [Bacteroidales bacterium]|nr:hypothetical protein [Bacteroidales bacterium]